MTTNHIRVNVSLPPDLVARLKKQKREHLWRGSLSAFVADRLERKLDSNEAKKTSKP